VGGSHVHTLIARSEAITTTLFRPGVHRLVAWWRAGAWGSLFRVAGIEIRSRLGRRSTDRPEQCSAERSQDRTRRAQQTPHSITSSARACSGNGTVTPRVFAVLRSSQKRDEFSPPQGSFPCRGTHMLTLAHRRTKPALCNTANLISQRPHRGNEPQPDCARSRPEPKLANAHDAQSELPP
jgi:hypothetical protein